MKILRAREAPGKPDEAIIELVDPEDFEVRKFALVHTVAVTIPSNDAYKRGLTLQDLIGMSAEVDIKVGVIWTGLCIQDDENVVIHLEFMNKKPKKKATRKIIMEA